MPITLNHSNIGVQYNTGSNYIIETVKSDLYLRNEIYNTIVSNNIQTAPVTPVVSIQDGSNIYAIESYTYSGTADTADYTRVFTKNTTCDILIVGGGGGGGGSIGGGGGGGSVIYSTNITIPTGTYTINIGKGGTGGVNQTDGTSGVNTIAFGATAIGGGRGGDYDVSNSKLSGGSGGGEGGGVNSGQAGAGVAALKGTNTIPNTSLLFTNYQYYVNNGGLAFYQIAGNNLSTRGGGGGGAGTAGGAGGGNAIDTTTQGLGGDGIPITITGGSVYYGAGGGGGGHRGNNAQASGKSGGLGGGGNGGSELGSVGSNGTDGTGFGAGGGGGTYSFNGGKGGSGIVIIRYLVGTIPSTNLLTSEPTVISPVMTETVRSFAHSGGTESQTTHTITVGQNTMCDILIVGGGGGGGFHTGGGGGAGGYYFQTNTIIASGTYIINVGKGGNGSANNNARGSNGNDTTFNGITAKGGGGGASDNDPTGNSGGSGGGADWNGTPGADTDANTDGNAGGVPINITGQYYGSGGGGAGSSGFTNGNGGTGKSNNITGTNTFYAAGGGGGRNEGSNWSGIGGSGIGGNGGNGNTAATSGLNGTGSGGGGSGFITGPSAANGGSGIVIIKFKSTTAISEGNPITHKRLTYVYNSDNLVAWYKFNGDYLDSSGNSHNLTNVGTVIQSTQVIEGQAVEFDSTDYLEFPASINPYTIWNGKGISFSCWVRFTAEENWGSLIFFQTDVSNNTGIGIWIKTTPISPIVAIYLRVDSTIFQYGDANTPLIANLNVWRHLVLCVGISGKMDVYLDNVRINGTETANIPNLTYNARYINRSRGDFGTWDGQMDDFRIYDRALSAADVSLLYNKTYSIPPNTYTLNFPVPTIADINNNSNIVLRGAYDIALSTMNSSIIPKTGQYIPKPTSFTNYSVERMYPPVRNFTAATTTVSGQVYGNGTYVVSFSAAVGGSLDPWTCFNTSSASGGAWPDNRYTAGVFNSTSFIVAGYLGDWLKIQLPVAIKLTRFEFLMRNEGVQALRDRAPKDFKIYGSNDNITWVELVNKTDAVYDSSFRYIQLTQDIITAYTYYGLVVNKLFSTSTILNFDEWYIYGQEVLSTPLSIRYNLLNPTLDPSGAQLTYNTSNTNVYHMGNVGIGTKNPEYSLDVSGSVNAKTIIYNGSSFNSLGLSIGMIAQVQHLTYTKMEEKNNTGWDAINEDLASGFVIKITPKSSLSKMLVNLIVFIGMSTSADNAWWGIKLYRKIGTGSWTEITGCNGTETGSGAATAGTPVWISNNTGMVTYNECITNASGTYLDSPNTTATVYYTAYWNQRIGDNPSVTGNMFLNRASLQNDAYRPAPSSSWTVEEIWYG